MGRFVIAFVLLLGAIALVAQSDSTVKKQGEKEIEQNFKQEAESFENKSADEFRLSGVTITDPDDGTVTQFRFYELQKTLTPPDDYKFLKLKQTAVDPNQKPSFFSQNQKRFNYADPIGKPIDSQVLFAINPDSSSEVKTVVSILQEFNDAAIFSDFYRVEGMLRSDKKGGSGGDNHNITPKEKKPIYWAVKVHSCEIFVSAKQADRNTEADFACMTKATLDISEETDNGRDKTKIKDSLLKHKKGIAFFVNVADGANTSNEAYVRLISKSGNQVVDRLPNDGGVMPLNFIAKGLFSSGECWAVEPDTYTGVNLDDDENSLRVPESGKIFMEYYRNSDGSGDPLCEKEIDVIKLEADPVVSGISVKYNDPINTIFNPAAILIGPSKANEVAIVKLTKVVPNLGFKEDDDRIVWTIEADDRKNVKTKGTAKFFAEGGKDDNTGTKVRLSGTGKGRILVKATMPPYEGPCEIYESRVVTIEAVRFRVNFLNGPIPDQSPTITLAEAKKQIALSNIYLRQVGIELMPDTDVRVNPNNRTNAIGNPVMLEKGYFKANVQRRLTDAVDTSMFGESSIRVNDNDGIVQINYVRSLSRGLGVAVNWPQSKKSVIKTFFRLKGPEFAKQFEVEPFDHELANNEPKTWGVLISSSSNPATKRALTVNIIVHELGHMLGYQHRLKTRDVINGYEYPDGIIRMRENIMQPTVDPGIAQDLDIIEVDTFIESKIVN